MRIATRPSTAEFSPGFRLSAVDVVILALGVGGSVFFGILFGWAGGLIGFVVAHFFLFCNVFRISRPPELAWAGVFLVATGATVVWNVPGWTATLLISLCVTILVVVLEMRKLSYHGIAWKKINPGLRDWWDAHVREESTAP